MGAVNHCPFRLGLARPGGGAWASPVHKAIYYQGAVVLKHAKASLKRPERRIGVFHRAAAGRKQMNRRLLAGDMSPRLGNVTISQSEVPTVLIVVNIGGHGGNYAHAAHYA